MTQIADGVYLVTPEQLTHIDACRNDVIINCTREVASPIRYCDHIICIRLSKVPHSDSAAESCALVAYATSAMHHAVQMGSRVYVHCDDTRLRSTFIACAYLMKYCDACHEAARELLMNHTDARAWSHGLGLIGAWDAWLQQSRVEM